MGILKNAMEEAIEEGNHLSLWECPKCEFENEDDFDIPPFDIPSNRARDWKTTSLTEIVCENCEEAFEGTIINSLGGVEFHLKDHEGTSISIDVSGDGYFSQQYDQDYSQWLDFDAPDDPFSEYMDSFHHIGDLIADYEDHHSSEIVIRMVFVHHITALEAYLSDTLINFVQEDNSALKKLLLTDDKLRQKKFSLDQIIGKEEFVANEAKAYLRGIMYHNLSRVEFLYKAAVGIDIFDLDIERSELQKAIELRHHCVHRNGKDKDGNALKVLTREYVDKVGEIIQKFAQNINERIANQISNGKF